MSVTLLPKVYLHSDSSIKLSSIHPADAGKAHTSAVAAALPQGTGMLHTQVRPAKPQAVAAVSAVTDDLAFFMRLQAGAPATAPVAPASDRCPIVYALSADWTCLLAYTRPTANVYATRSCRPS